ncbi:MAG: ethylbenzene dehydrogenase-related protein [Solirubrobacteraceae bacterium]
MEAKRLNGSLADPGASVWEQASAERVALAAAPLASQQSRYIRTAWSDRPYGLVRELIAQAAHDGDSFYLRLEWSSPTRKARESGESPFSNPIDGPDAFPDAVAAMFPATGDPEIDTKGSEEAPVRIWRWAEGVPEIVEELHAGGLGTLQPADGDASLWARSGADGARWQVVFGRPLGTDQKAAPRLDPGVSTRVAFAVWTGGNQERAGIKSYSQRWVDLALEQ